MTRHLHNYPFGTALDVNMLIDPDLSPFNAGRIGTLYFTILNSWEHTPFSVMPIETQWARNQQKIPRLTPAHLDINAVVERLRLPRIIRRIVDRIHLS